MGHDINQVGNECTYNLRALVSTNGKFVSSDVLVKQFINNMNLFLTTNNVVDVRFEVSAGVGTPIIGIKYPGEYTGRLTAKFTLANPKTPGNDRITKLEGISRYYVSDPTNGAQDVAAKHKSNMGAFQ